MNTNISSLLLVIAFMSFLLAVFGVSARINLVALGLAAWVAVQLVGLVIR